MNNSVFYFRKIIKLFFICFVFLLYSCDDQSLLIDPENSNIYKLQTFKIDADVSNSIRLQDYSSGESPFLYSGEISDSSKSYVL